MSGLPAGVLTTQLAVRRRVAGTDAMNLPADAWELVDNVWSQPKGATGMGTIRASGDVPAALNRYSFRIRYRSDFDVNMQVEVLRTGELMDIVGIRHDLERFEWTDLVCEQGGANG